MQGVSLGELLTIICIVAGVCVYTFTIVRYLVDRIDTAVEKERLAREADVKTLAAKEEFDRHVAATDRQIESMREDIKLTQTHFVKIVTDFGIQVNTRLDQILISFTKMRISESKDNSND